ncbi:hypothetical protein [Streptomyces geranii]|uniref:hypothetical protein n=1 Tax=Streptomyces geranii TaxID=2058923 RepID=UPI000D03D8DD|nr:hypothetical protein [Streptomyces geranii]
MSPVAPQALGHARRRGWLRAFVLLLALSMPGGHAGARAVPVSVAAAESGSAVFEYDVLDSVLRPVTRGAGRSVVPLRPVPAPVPGPAARPLPTHTPPAAPSLRAPRSVVLRC